jgi:ribosome-binding protein aMBF1 (putative translation factor)
MPMIPFFPDNFMPKKHPRKIAPVDSPISRELHSAIVDHVAVEGRTLYSLAKLAGVDEATLRKFQSRERSLTLQSVDRLAAFLGLKLVRSARAKPKASAIEADRPALASDDVSSD